MDINELLKQKKITKYRLSKSSGVPQATVSDICGGKTKIDKCSADTIYKLAKTLDVTMESLIGDAMEHRAEFETFKSNVCHLVKNMGDINFIIEMLESNKIKSLHRIKRYPECLYLLAMVDYLCRENGLPVCTEYDDLRKTRLKKIIFPASIVAASAAKKNDKMMKDCLINSIPEFIRFNIVENEVRNVY